MFVFGIDDGFLKRKNLMILASDKHKRAISSFLSEKLNRSKPKSFQLSDDIVFVKQDNGRYHYTCYGAIYVIYLTGHFFFEELPKLDSNFLR
jgi:hypothetical protein